MISPELLRRYPFFGNLNEAELTEIAKIAEEKSFEKGTTLFEEGQPAEALYFLLEGGVDLYFKSEEQYHPKTRKEFLVGEINPGEIFSLSALIEPYILNATARVSQGGRLIKIEASTLRIMAEKDPDLGCKLMHQIAKALMERLKYTRIQLAAERA
jgi:CRP-like cAMP-binding protein